MCQNPPRPLLRRYEHRHVFGSFELVHRVAYRLHGPHHRTSVHRLFHLFRSLRRGLNDVLGQTRQPRDVDAVTPRARSLRELVQEGDLLRAAFAPHVATHVTQTHARVVRPVVRQSVVVRGKHRPGAEVHEMIRHRRRDRRAIAGRGAAPQLVHRHERVRRGAPQHRRRLGQLGHERGLARDDVILGAHANENRIRGGHRERSRRDIRSDVRHDRGEAHLPNQRRFTPHVGARQEQERRVAAAAELGVVGHERFSSRERRGARVPESNRVQRRRP